jgi:tellurite resistance protein
MSFDPAALLKFIDANKLAALVETMMLAAGADGEISDDERAQLARSVQDIAQRTHHAEALTADKLTRLMDDALERIVMEGRKHRIGVVKQILGDIDSRKAALGLAVRVTAADGIVRTTERELIFDLAEGLEVDQDEAANLVREITRRS